MTCKTSGQTQKYPLKPTSEWPARQGICNGMMAYAVFILRTVTFGSSATALPRGSVTSTRPSRRLCMSGEARGAAVTAVVTQSIEVSEYAARSVKQVVTGSGSADKDRVQTMVKHMLELNGKLQNDAADGLAIALCHAHSRGYGAVAGAVSSAGGGAVSRLPVRRKTRGRGLRR